MFSHLKNWLQKPQTDSSYLSELRQRRRELIEVMTDNSRLRARIEELEEAIRQHRDFDPIEAAKIHPDLDRQLWSVLDSKHVSWQEYKNTRNQVDKFRVDI